MKRPWMKFYVAEFFNDPAVQEMSHLQRSVYMSLIGWNWLYGGIEPGVFDGSASDAFLKRFGSVSRWDLKRSWSVLKVHFVIGKDGKLWNKRALREITILEKDRTRKHLVRGNSAVDSDSDSDEDIRNILRSTDDGRGPGQNGLNASLRKRGDRR